MGKKAVWIGFLFLLPALMFGVKVQKVMIENFQDLKDGVFQNLVIEGEGRLKIGPRTDVLKSPEEEYYLSLASDQNGNLYVGTGHEASVYRIDGEDSVQRIFTADHLDIYALQILGDGTLLAAASPSGKIYQLKDNKRSVFFDPKDRMIWDLAEDKKGTIYAAVGAGGGVYALKGSGTGRPIPGIGDYHILSLLVTADNRLLAGSGENGILFEYQDGRIRVLFDSPYREIKGIAEDSAGNIYFSATMGGYPVPQLKIQENDDKEKSPVVQEKNQKPPPPVYYKSTLYKMDRMGVVEELWKLKDEYIYDIMYDSHFSGILVATGNWGRTYLVREDGSFALLHKGDFSQAYQFGPGKDGVYLITNNSPSLIKVSYQDAQKGEYVSPVFDMKVKSRIGKLYWNSGYEAVKGLSLMLRAGNTSNPDSSWMDWSGPYFDPQGAAVNIEGYRYFQIQVLLNDLNVSYPVFLKDISLYYLQANIQPRIKSVKVAPGSQSKKSSHQLKVSWEAVDRNDDQLQYSLYIKPVAESRWILLKKDMKKNTYEIDRRLFQDGLYHLRIRADDSPDNPGGSTKSVFRVTDPFILDSTAPVLVNFSRSREVVTFQVRDTASVIKYVVYSHDGETWKVIFPDDGICDSPEESFTLNVVQSGYLFIKVSDEAGNEKVFQNRLL